MKKRLGIDIEWVLILKSNTSDTIIDKEVHGYPTSVCPYNSMYDVKQKLTTVYKE